MSKSTTRRGFLQSGLAAAGVSAGISRSAWPTELAAAETPAFEPRYAICNETFGDSPFDDAFRVAAECGYQGLEVAPFTVANDVRTVSAAKRQEIRRQSKQAGVRITGLHWLLARTKGIHLTSPDADVRRETAEYLGALGDFCADLGGDLLVFGSPKQRNLMPGVSREQGMEYAADVVGKALPRLEKANVRLAFEPLAPRTTNFLRTAADAVELVDRIGSPRVRLILDCNAMATEKTSIPDLIRKYHKYLVHFHANDPNSQGPGFGELDFLPIFQALREVQFRGWVSVEVFDYKPGAERLARESIAYMRECVKHVNAG